MSLFGWKKNIEALPIETMLLFEERQLLYLPEHGKRRELALVFRARPHIAWYVQNKAPALSEWMEALTNEYRDELLPEGEAFSALCTKLLESMEDWVVYVTAPEDYDTQVFTTWDANELTGLADFSGKIVVDIGSGTGKQAFAAAPLARYVYCVEPVYNLRKYLKAQAKAHGFHNVFVVDGLLEGIPFHEGFADIVTGGHVFGDDMETEYAELTRVTKKGGTIVLCPGNVDRDNDTHRFLTDKGFSYRRFLEPGDTYASGWVRSYWKVNE